jgi:NTP pyrophosphatase (non-canonical NTP hydrolase)
MNSFEHVLTCLAEECGEVATELLALQKECHKALRFGLDDKVTFDPSGPRGTNGPTNAEKIVDELNDLMGVVAKLSSLGAIPKDWQCDERSKRKVAKVESFMGYAEQVGALQPQPTTGETR